MEIGEVLKEFVTTWELSDRWYNSIIGYSQAIFNWRGLRRAEVLSIAHEALYNIREEWFLNSYSKEQQKSHFKYALYSAHHTLLDNVYKYTENTSHYNNLDTLWLEDSIDNIDFTDSLLKLFDEILTYTEYAVIYHILIAWKTWKETWSYLWISQQQVSVIYRAAKRKLRKYLSNYY